jgi:hypothetical protein
MQAMKDLNKKLIILQKEIAIVKGKVEECK